MKFHVTTSQRGIIDMYLLRYCYNRYTYCSKAKCGPANIPNAMHINSNHMLYV